MIEQIVKICEWCNKEFIPKQKPDKTKFCSRDCFYKWIGKQRENKVEITCTICGKKRSVKRAYKDRYKTCGSKECHSKYMSSKLKNNQFSKGTIVSVETRKKISESMKGDKNHNWINGSGAYKRIASESLEHKCYICGSTKRLEVHHKDFNGLTGNNSLENLEYLCKSCHTKIHNKIRNIIGNKI